jgi:hypothetical protein
LVCFQRVARSFARISRLSLGVAVVTSTASLACSARREVASAEGARAATPRRAAEVTPARLIPPTRKGEVLLEAFEVDGSRRFVAQGLRVLERPDGALETADEFLPATQGIEATALPPWLGGGYVFRVSGGVTTSLYRAASWTGALEPLSRIDAEIERMVPGPDRLYALVKRAETWIALDAKTGRGATLDGLPPSPSYGAMAFPDEWFGAVEVPIRGVLATFDAGATWHATGLRDAGLSLAAEGVVIDSSEGRLLLDRSGAIRPAFEPPKVAQARGRGERPADELALSAPLPPPLGPRPLEQALLYGFPDSDESAIVLSHGNLVRVRLRDGAILAASRGVYPGPQPCQAVLLGAGVGFVCSEEQGATRVFALRDPLGLTPIAVFDAPRRVSAADNGALVVDGACAAEPSNAASYCVLPARGEPYELAVGGDRGVERVVALSDGRAAVLVPPRLGAPGLLTLTSRNGRGITAPLELPDKLDSDVQNLLEHGLWLNSFTEPKQGELSGWVYGAGHFVGVRVSLDGSVKVGQAQQGLERAFISGRRGLVLGVRGGAYETTDGGFEWTDVDLPSEPDLAAPAALSSVNGCSAVGCAFSGWLRVGWGSLKKGALPTAGAPEPARLRLPSGGRWSLECTPTGEVSAPSLAVMPEPEERREGPWNPFYEIAAPRRVPGDIALDIGGESELDEFHAYAWGPKLNDWNQRGRFLVRAADPFRVSGAVWETLPTEPPWQSPELTADAFGLSPGGPPAAWRVLLDPRGRSGLLVVAARGTTELFLLEEGKPIFRLNAPGSLGVLSSVAQAGGHFYIGSVTDGRGFRVSRVEAGGLVLVGEYPDAVPRSGAPILVPATQGTGIGLWIRSGDFYLYPIDPQSGAVDAPLVVQADTLSTMPRACSGSPDGYLVSDALSLDPQVDFAVVGAPIRARQVEAKLLVSAGELCIDALRAKSEAPIADEKLVIEPAAAAPKSDPGAPLALFDRRDRGRRLAFRCWD